MKFNRLKVVNIGGFGHNVCVFNEMIGFDKAELIGVSPAYDGEDMSTVINHPIAKDGVKVYDNHKQMLAETKPDIAIISTRLDMIPKATIDAANAGCHLICEKPLAIDIDTLKDVYKAVKKNRVKLAAMLTIRSESIFRAAKSIYDSGAIGEAVLCNGRKSYKYGTRPEWFGDKKHYGGTVAWVGIHAFDFINYVTGLKFTKVAAMGGNFAHTQRPDCNDNVAICATLSNGGHSTISVDYLRPQESATHGDDWVRIVGTKGIIESRGSNLTCTSHTQKEPVNVELPQNSRIFEEFMLSIFDGGKDDDSKKIAFELTYACLCAEKSIADGCIVDIKQDIWE